MKILWSRHAIEKADGLGIELKEAETIIRQGMKWKEGKNKWHANMHGYEVVFEEMEDILYVITVYPAETPK